MVGWGGLGKLRGFGGWCFPGPEHAFKRFYQPFTHTICRTICGGLPGLCVPNAAPRTCPRHVMVNHEIEGGVFPAGFTHLPPRASTASESGWDPQDSNTSISVCCSIAFGACMPGACSSL